MSKFLVILIWSPYPCSALWKELWEDQWSIEWARKAIWSQRIHTKTSLQHPVTEVCVENCVHRHRAYRPKPLGKWRYITSHCKTRLRAWDTICSFIDQVHAEPIRDWQEPQCAEIKRCFVNFLYRVGHMCGIPESLKVVEKREYLILNFNQDSGTLQHSWQIEQVVSLCFCKERSSVISNRIICVLWRFCNKVWIWWSGY